MNVIYIAQFHETCGYSHAAIGYLKSIVSVLSENKEINFKILSTSLNARFLDKRVYESSVPRDTLDLIDEHHISDQSDLERFLETEYLCIWHMTSVTPAISNQPGAGFFHKNLQCSLEKIILGATRNYHILAWETDKLPQEYEEMIKNYDTDTIIAPSEWNSEVFKKSFNSVRIPHLIEENDLISTPVALPDLSGRFVIFSMSEWTNRKNFQCLIRSYLLEFQHQQDVLLVLKISLPSGMKKEEFINHFSFIKDSVRTHQGKKPNIAVIIDYISSPKIKYLYECCDIFCLTSLGEGFSLPCSEAAMHSKPVLCPRFGGHIDFLDTDNKYFIDGVWDTVFDNPPYDSDGLWFIPTVDSTRKGLRAAYEDWSMGSLKAHGDKNKRKIQDCDFSRKDIGSKIVSVLQSPQKQKSDTLISSLKKQIQNKSLEEQMKILKDKYHGKDCYILNCGPSLNEHNPETLKNFLKDKLTFTIKQSQDLYGEVSDFHFFNCSNLPRRNTATSIHYKNSKDTITVASSNYDQYHRWSITQSSDIFFKIPVRTEINNEFLVRTGEIDEYLIKNNLTRPCGPGIMYETVLFMAIHLGVKSVTVLGWDLTMNKVTENNYKHFYGSTDKLINRGDILDWEIKETRNFSETFFNWCTNNGISLSLVSEQSSLSPKIPRVKLELK